ncbi:MAG: LysM peptidoglycan-binding domain-containing protein, partial [Spirochaetales bacterium]|nr:LysM peptidoglycan-binding domain-containing protein [Spirochaetales bacterium]
MSDETNYIYPVVPNDTLSEIALRFYGTYEPQLLEILKDLNGLPDIDTINVDELKLPYFYPYGHFSTNRSGGPQQYVYNIKQGASVKPVEFHHSELEGEPVAARRFVYCWKKEVPRELSELEFKRISEALSDQADKDRLEDFYHYDPPAPPDFRTFATPWESKLFPREPWTLNELMMGQKEELYELLTRADYPVWKNKGILMTDDWGQPWRIEEYIRACKEKGYFRYVASNYTEKQGELDDYDYASLDFESNFTDDSIFFYSYTDEFSSEDKFAFYTPQEIEGIHFIEKAGYNPEECERDTFTVKANLDKREYFQPGDECIFAFAPLDVLWARDEYVNLEKYPELRERNMEGINDGDPLDYVKNVIKRTNFGEIVNHPPTYFTSGDWDPEQMVEEGLAQYVQIPQPQSGTYTEQAIRIDLEPTIYEYLSLLQKHTHDICHALKLHIKSSQQLAKLDMSIDEIMNLTNLMKNYPNESDLDDDYLSKVATYQEALEKLRNEVNEKEINPKFSSVESGVDDWDLTDKAEEALGLIQNEKPTEFIDLSQRLEKLEAFLNKEEFMTKLEDYLGQVAEENYRMEIDYFSFRHPYNTPVEILCNTFMTLAQHPDEEEGDRIYTKYIKPLEARILSTYTDGDQQEFHNEVTKEILRQYRDFSCEIDVGDEGNPLMEVVPMCPEGEGNDFFVPGEFLESVINDSDEYMDGEDRQALSSRTVMGIVWDYLSYSLLAYSWNNQEGAASFGTKLLKCYQFYRYRKLLGATERIYKSVVARDYKLAMTVMAKTYTGINRGVFNTKLPNKQAVVRAYMEAAAPRYYGDYFLRVNPSRKKPVNIGTVRNGYRNTMKRINAEMEKRVRSTGTAPAWVSTGFSAFQLFMAFQGITRFFGNEDPEWTDYVELAASLSAGALALTGFHTKHVQSLINIFPRFRRFDLESTVLLRNTRFGAGLTGAMFIADMLLYGNDAIWNMKTGDRFLATINMTRALVSGVGASIWIGAFFTSEAAVGAVVGSLLGLSPAVSAFAALSLAGLILFVILILLSVIVFIRNKFKTGTRNTMELFVNEILKNNIKKVEKGSEFHDQTTLFNLASMWRITEGNQVTTYPPISPYIKITQGNMMVIEEYRKRSITYTIKREPVQFEYKNDAYKYGRLDYEPLNYRYAVPAMVFRGWDLDMIQNLHKTGWGESHE